MSDTKKVLSFITWMNIIGCLLVIVGHSYPFVTDIPPVMLNIRTFIYDFHMPLFVWCAGYLIVASCQVEKYSFGTYILRKVKHLLIPYFVFSLIGVIPKMLASSFLNDSFSFNAAELIRAFLVPRENIWGHFWFLPMIFILEIIGYMIEFIAKKSNKGLIYSISILAGALGCFAPICTGWFAINDIVHFAFYLFLGIACASIKPFALNLWAKLLSLVCLIVSVLTFVLLPHEKYISFAISILMLFAIWMLSLTLGEIKEIDRGAIYAQTYPIFVLSWPCQLVVNVVLERILHLPIAVTFPTTLIAGIAGPLVLIYLVDLFENKTHTKFISKTIGR